MGEQQVAPRVLPGGVEESGPDHRVAAVLEVLAGHALGEVAARWSVDVAVLHRWVRAFVDAGTAQVTNTPAADAAHQRDRFLAAFAHELRTPLTVAQGWVTMLDEEVLPEAARAAAVRRTHEALGRLAGRVRDVELLVAASLGRLTLLPRPTPLGELVQDLAGVGEVGGEGAAVTLDVDPELFARVLRDLWEAAGARPIPRSLRLVVTTVAPWVEIRVERDADPIEPHLLRALFEPFDLNDDGTGITIGLYLARALTVAHGGTVGVDQDEEGAVLWVRVPCSDQGDADRRRPEITVEEP